MPLVHLIPTSLEMGEGHLCIVLIESHHVLGVISAMLTNQLAYVFDSIKEELLVRLHSLSHQQSMIIIMQAETRTTKDDIIEEILALQQEIQAYENRSQFLQHENKFYQSQIVQLKRDIREMEQQSYH